MKRILLSFLQIGLLSFVCQSLSAHDFYVGGIYYNYLSETDKTVAVTFKGDKYDSYGNEYSGNVVIPESVSYDGTTYSVTSIGESAFEDCTGVTSIVIPNCVTSIGSYAFGCCTGLTNIEISNSVTSIGSAAFYGCKGLTSIVVDSNNSVYDSRHNCNAIIETSSNALIAGCKSTIIPNSVTSIGNSAFYYCTGLTNIEISNSVTSIGSEAFYGCKGLTSIVIPNSVTSIGSGAFAGCTGLTSIIVDSGNNVYDSRNNCNAIIKTSSNTLVTGCKNTIVPNGVTSLGNYAFYNCTGLTSIEIPNSVTSIGKQVFKNCSGLTSIVIPNSVTSIGSSAFSGCSSLESITLPFVGDKPHTPSDTYQYPFGYIFGTDSYTGGTCTMQYYLVISTRDTKDCYYIPSSLKSVKITSSNHIPYGAFDNCTGLTSIEIPNSVTSIGSEAFCNCTRLTSIEIPNSVTSIGERAFIYCVNLTSIEIPNSVTSIGSEAFYGTKWYNNQPDGLVYVGKVAYKFKGTMPGNTSVVLNDGTLGIAEDAFSGCLSLTSFVIPNSVTSIGKGAFNGCNNLIKVYNYSSLTLTKGSSDNGCVAYYATAVYNNCQLNGDYVITYEYYNSYVCGYVGQETELTLPATYGISNYAFYGCKNLTKVSIPNGAKRIGDDAFYGCTSLTNIEIPNSVTSIGSEAFYNCTSLTNIEIPNNVTSIGGSAFYNCKNLTSIEIPNGVTSISGYAFYGCTGLTSIVIPNSVTSIGFSAFYNCNNLKKVYNCSSLTLTKGLGDNGLVAYYATAVYNNCQLEEGYVFTDVNDKKYVCGYLGQETELTLPATYGISDYAFNDCKNLKKISIPNGVASIGGNAFSGCTSLKKIEIPNSVTSISDYAFHGCSGLKSIVIPNGVMSIGKSAFENCSGTLAVHCDIEDAENSNEGWFYGSKFSEVILGETVNKVGKYAFYGSTSIKSLTIGGNVNRIGYYAFDNCTGLKSIYSNAVNPPACRDNAFHEDTKWDCPLYVPKESLEAYKAANVWKSFLDIKENPFYSSLESIATMDKNDAPLYDLQGTQVVAPRPNGLYIRDGKKLILK